MPGESGNSKNEAPLYKSLLLLFFFLLGLRKELIASPAPACSQDPFCLLHFELALTFQLSVPGFTHDFPLFLYWQLTSGLAYCLLLFIALSSFAADPETCISLAIRSCDIYA